MLPFRLTSTFYSKEDRFISPYTVHDNYFASNLKRRWDGDLIFNTRYSIVHSAGHGVKTVFSADFYFQDSNGFVMIIKALNY